MRGSEMSIVTPMGNKKKRQSKDAHLFLKVGKKITKDCGEGLTT